MTVSLTYTAFTSEQESRQRKTWRKQPWNWRHSSVEYVPFQAESVTCTEGQVSSKVCKSPKQLERTSKLAPRDAFCNKAGKKLNAIAGSTSWDKAEKRTEHADTNLRCLIAPLLIPKAATKYASQQCLFSARLYSCKKMQTTLRRWRNKEQAPRVLSSSVQPHVSVWQDRCAARRKVFCVGVWRTQMHCLQRWRTCSN